MHDENKNYIDNKSIKEFKNVNIHKNNVIASNLNHENIHPMFFFYEMPQLPTKQSFQKILWLL